MLNFEDEIPTVDSGDELLSVTHASLLSLDRHCQHLTHVGLPLNLYDFDASDHDLAPKPSILKAELCVSHMIFPHKRESPPLASFLAARYATVKVCKDGGRKADKLLKEFRKLQCSPGVQHRTVL